jgi:hypothetical protein
MKRRINLSVDKHLSDTVPFHNNLREAKALSSLFLNLSSDYAIKKVQENRLVEI